LRRVLEKSGLAVVRLVPGLERFFYEGKRQT